MATSAELLGDTFSRVRETVNGVLHATDEEHLARPPAPGANTVAWLVWHLTRILDDHVAGAFDLEQVWTRDGWYERFALPFPAEAHGYGHTWDDVLAVRVPGADLRGYHAAVQEAAAAVLVGLTDDDLDRVVDEDWDPPVTLAVRLVSVVNDIAQHAGQAAYASGILGRS
ncbi:mycothiol transferase [Oryzobacter telluris]|uniref:mycothiol transferase n=1 Tax=Oryzobacter telluris TaxID=3149179 RepID=UPI00370DAA22